MDWMVAVESTYERVLKVTPGQVVSPSWGEEIIPECWLLLRWTMRYGVASGLRQWPRTVSTGMQAGAGPPFLPAIQTKACGA